MPISEVYNIDNMIYMATVPDKFFSLAIVDPPYGIGFGQYERGSSGIKVKERYTKNGKKKWDDHTPNDEYFKELFRISMNQIIWGGNYFIQIAKVESPNLKTKEQFTNYISNSDSKWIFWYKQNPVPNFADGELAWISFSENKVFDLMYYGNINRDVVQIVPTQKPVQLYKWLLKNYAKPGDTIFDSHMGSQSSRIACYEGGFDFVGCELDKEYFDAGNKRFENYKLQLKLNF
jgi:site-specific DNA-methyltransferase (adenine-specific)